MSTSRAATPDIARGLCLALIAVANATWWLGERDPHTWWDRAADLLLAVAVDGRVYPLFVFLLGYGITQFLSRGRPGQSRALLRRGAVMVALGLFHGVLLWQGDVLAAYGMLTVLALLILVPRSTRTLWWLSGLMGASTAVVAVTMSLLPAVASESSSWALLTSTDAVRALGARVSYWATNSFLSPLMPSITLPLVLGLVSARHRLLEDVQRHRDLLMVLLAAAPVGWISGVLLWSLDDASLWLLDAVVGMLTAAGYVAALALLSLRADLPGVQALGRNSMTGYLIQSVALVPLLAPWALGLSLQLGELGVVALALLVWAATLLWARARLRDASPFGYRRGPFERLVRRVMWPSAVRSR